MKKTIIGVMVIITLCALLFEVFNFGFLDVVLKYGIKSFAIAADEKARLIEKNSLKTWDIYSGESNGFGVDYISNEQLENITGIKIWMRIDAAPFIAAGLNVSRLQSNVISYEPNTNTLFVHRLLKDFPLSEISNLKKNIKMSDFLFFLIKNNRNYIMYHKDTDRFGIEFGDSFMFEWDKKFNGIGENLYWVLNLKPLIEAGLNTDSLNTEINRHIIYINVN